MEGTRKLKIVCKSFDVTAKRLLMHPIHNVVIQLQFFGENKISRKIDLNESDAENVKVSLSENDKFYPLKLKEPYAFEFNIPLELTVN